MFWRWSQKGQTETAWTCWTLDKVRKDMKLADVREEDADEDC